VATVVKVVAAIALMDLTKKQEQLKRNNGYDL
jgi:hypothetical protein